jgi:predicted DNA-binding transcriptional regulator YafY
MKKTNLQKTLFVLEEFHRRQDGILDAYDAVLIKEFGDISTRQLGRFLDALTVEIDNIEAIKVGRRNAYRLIKPMDLFVETFKNSHEISWIFNMAHEGNPEVFQELEQFTKKTKHVFQFKNTPFEDTKTLEEQTLFKTLKRAVENREYVKITFKGNDTPIDNLKCLKLIFMEGNWYLAYVNAMDRLRFGRVSFMQTVTYATKRESFQPMGVKKQMAFLKTIQNAMTLYDVPKKIARLKVNSYSAKYFTPEMKPFFSSQKFEKQLDDGSIIFTIEYTQTMEIMPFIQSWLPNISILEPAPLKEAYRQRLLRAQEGFN